MGVAVAAKTEAVRKGRILLMDDEELVRTIVGIMIGTLGHEVEFAEMVKRRLPGTVRPSPQAGGLT